MTVAGPVSRLVQSRKGQTQGWSVVRGRTEPTWEVQSSEHEQQALLARSWDGPAASAIKRAHDGQAAISVAAGTWSSTRTEPIAVWRKEWIERSPATYRRR